MTTPIDIAKDYCEKLTANGVRATHDPRRIVAPCILIAPPTVDLNRGCGGRGEWTAYALAATGPGNADAWQQLDHLVNGVLGILPVKNIYPTEYRVDDASPFPAFQMTWSEAVEWSL